MPKVKPEYRLSDEETPTPPPIQELVARELAERDAVSRVGDLVYLPPATANETLYPDQNVEIPPLPPEPPRALPAEPDVAEAKRRIDAIFASALGEPTPTLETILEPPDRGTEVQGTLKIVQKATDLPPLADDATSRLRREVLTELVQEGWKHSDAVTVANRVKAMLDVDENLTVAIAKEDAVYEFENSKPQKARQVQPFVDEEPLCDPSDPSDPTDPTDLTDPISAGTGLTGHGEPNDELLQIVHNLERDAARLRKLFGLEGVKKTRKGKLDG